MAKRTVKNIQSIATELLFHGEKNDVVENMEVLSTRVEGMVAGTNDLLNQVQGAKAELRPGHAQLSAFLEQSLRDTIGAFESVLGIPQQDMIRAFVRHTKLLHGFVEGADRVVKAFHTNVLPIAQQWVSELARSAADNRRLVLLEKILRSRARNLQEPIGAMTKVGEDLRRAVTGQRKDEKEETREGDDPPSVSWITGVRVEEWLAWGAFRFVHDTLLGWVFPTMAQAFLGLLLAVSDAKGMDRVATAHSVLKTTLIMSTQCDAKKVPAIGIKESAGWSVFKQTYDSRGVLCAARDSGLAFVHRIMFALDPEGSDHFDAVRHRRIEHGIQGSAFTKEEVSRDVEHSAYSTMQSWFTRGWLFRALARFHPSSLVQAVVSFIIPGEPQGTFHDTAEHVARVTGVHDALTTIVAAVLIPVLAVIGFKAIVWSTSALQAAFRFLTGGGASSEDKEAWTPTDRVLVRSLKRGSRPLETVRDAIWG
jgi:hypothetical protein